MGIIVLYFFNKRDNVICDDIPIFDFLSNAPAELIFVNLYIINMDLVDYNRLVIYDCSHDSITYDKLLLKTVDRIAFMKGESAVKVSIFYNEYESPYVLLIAFGRNRK